jgi:hypothetical protein
MASTVIVVTIINYHARVVICDSSIIAVLDKTSMMLLEARYTLLEARFTIVKSN